MNRPPARLRRPRLAAALAVACGLAAGLAGAGCRGSGDFSVLGYSTAPPFDPNIRSVYIPVFKNRAFHTTPFRGVEAELSQAIVEELARRRSPIRVVSDPCQADTELVGTITQINKLGLNINLQNQLREYNVWIVAEVVWRDLRTGRVLSGQRQPETPEGAPPDPFDPNRPPPPARPPDYVANPVTVTAMGRVIPEVGESTTTGMKAAVDAMARQIVNMMESPWDAGPARPARPGGL